MTSINLPPLKSQSANLSSHKLLEGLTLVGKSLASTLQWTGEFTNIQNEHYEQLKAREKELENMLKKPNNYKEKIMKGFSKFTQKICRLCLQQKPSENFILMSSCQHPFCFSCLNTYAISKIQDHERVACPHPGCFAEMKLGSQVYKYLPEKIKLKYLEYLIKNKERKINLKDKCLRCLEPQHTGQCKVVLNKQTIEKAFEFRKCRHCMTEMQMTVGRRKVCCQKCQHSFCYLCGQDWPQQGKHECQEIPKIKELEHQVNESQCCEADCCQTYDGCCVCCQCCESYCLECCPSLQLRCCQNCGECMQSCCYCQDCDPSILIGNLCCFLIRIVLTVGLMALYALMMIPLSVFLALWLGIGIAIGVTLFPITIISESESFGKFFAILFCPLLTIPGIVLGPMYLGKSFSSVLNDYCEIFSTGICSLWICCSPQECCSCY